MRTNWREDPRVGNVVDELVAAGLLEAGRAAQAGPVVQSALARAGDGDVATLVPVRRRLAEVAGYVGGALVVAAAAVFLAQTWADLGLAGRVGVLLGMAAVLALAAGAVGLRRTDPTRRRLASTLATGAVVATAWTAGVVADRATAAPNYFDVAPEWLAGAVTALVLGVVVYRLVPSMLAQVGLAVAAVVTVIAGLEVLDASEPLSFALVALALGAGWVLLAERRVWREQVTGQAVGASLALVAPQALVMAGEWDALGYVLTFGVAMAAVVLYVRTRGMVYLGAGVLGVTLAVPEALLDWTSGSLGPVGVLLAAGLTLLLASLAGLRLRQEVVSSG